MPAIDPRSSQDLHGQQYAIVGGGVSGLAAAWYLQGRGAATHIFESAGELGGRAGSGELGGRVVTLGGKNIGRSYARFRAFTSSLGHHRYEYFGINSSRVVDGRLATFDSERRVRMLTNLRGMSVRDVAHLTHLMRMLKRRSDARYLSEASCRRLAERYGNKTMQDVFSRQLREVILRSLTVRVSAAEPDEVPITNALPYLGMIIDTYDQLSDGMHAIVGAAARRSRVSVGTAVRRLVLEQNRVCGVEITTPDGDRASETFDGVVIATSAHAAAGLLETVVPAGATLLGQVRYFPLVVLLVEYERPVFDSSVRAIMFGPERALSNAGAYGSADLNTVRYTFSGRRARVLAGQEPDPERLAAMAEGALSPHAHVTGNARRAMTAHRFLPGLCAYHQDQAGFLERLRAAGTGIQGLHLTGDYLRGCSIEACFAAAEQVVAAI
ncbi:MAG TPA: FAD-dependent oxidoreductase [Solirubrobacteraceae bacterium]|nr:FAD-dependent oxidoreductase [Solirubrobacteraceae bacterium]